MEPNKSFRIPDQSRRANAGDCEKMKKRSVAQWKLLDDTEKRRREFRPPFAKLHEGSFDLRRIERCGRFFSNPTISAIHRAKHHADSAERLVGAARSITATGEAPEREALFPELGSQPDSCRPVRRRV